MGSYTKVRKTDQTVSIFFINIVLIPCKRVRFVDKVNFNSEKLRPNTYQTPSENALQSIFWVPENSENNWQQPG